MNPVAEGVEVDDICGKFFKLSSCSKNLKLTFLCAFCPSKAGVYISADPFSSSNLRMHISRKHGKHLNVFDMLRKNRPKRQTNQVLSSIRASSFKNSEQSSLSFIKRGD